MATDYENYCAVLYAIEKISQGKTPTAAVDAANISWATFTKYIETVPELATLKDEAEQRGADAMADGLVSIFDPTNPYHESDEKKAKIISDNIKWLLSRRFGRKYGEKIEIKQETTITHVITQQLEQARQRSITAQRPDVIDLVEGEGYVMLPPPPPTPVKVD